MRASKKHTVSATLLKSIATRTNDCMLICCILVLGLAALYGAHTSFERVNRAYEMAGRV